ncbi:MAG: ice-binding family protein [bacterium]|nr:ice-binding family protein [bacterium]
MGKVYKSSISALVIAFTLGMASLVIAATSVDLGTADDFAILAGSTVTNTGSSVITGDLGLSPGTSVTGFPPGTLDGTEHVADTTADQAKTDLVTAYNDAAGQTPVSTVPTELGGTTKTAGIYDSTSGTFGITGTLTLDAAGDPNAVFIFQTASTLITAGASEVVLTNGAQACNVFWQVGSSATLGTDSTFKGNILALTSATLTNGASVEGSVLARNGAVTLDTNTVTKATCAAPTELTVTKTVVNTGDGTMTVSDFSLFIDGDSVTSGDSNWVIIGEHTVSETSDSDYTSVIGGDCAADGTVTVALGESLTCTITNTYIVPAADITPELTVNKVVINDNGGTKVISDFSLFIDGDSVTSGNTNSVTIGEHTVSETSDSGYTSVIGGDCAADGTITLALGDVKTCTITNDDVVLVSDTGGTNSDTGGTTTTTPKLPSTGLSSSENNIPWNIIVPAGIFAILTLFHLARRKQTS